jgi:hypothetical protein
MYCGYVGLPGAAESTPEWNAEAGEHSFEQCIWYIGAAYFRPQERVYSLARNFIQTSMFWQQHVLNRHDQARRCIAGAGADGDMPKLEGKRH